MSASSTLQPGRPPTAVAPALLERHRAGLRAYLATLPGAEASRVDTVVAEVIQEVANQAELEDDPAVWLFQAGRRRMLAGGPRGEIIAQGDDAAGDESLAEGEDPRLAVHRTFGRLTAKQQEVLRLKFQFGIGLEELARVTDLGRASAGSLLHHAMERLGQSLRPPDAAEAFMPDPRLTAFALDELEGPEKQAFVETAGNGKRLLEQSEALRRAGQLLTQVLTSGAPVPKRRRRRRAAAWRSPAVLVSVLALLLIAGVAWWYGSQPGAKTKPAALQVQAADEVDGSSSGRATAADAKGPRRKETGTMVARAERELRPGEADWERKPFGRGLAQGGGASGGTSSAAGGPASVSGGGVSAASPAGVSDAGPAVDNGGERGENAALASDRSDHQPPSDQLGGGRELTPRRAMRPEPPMVISPLGNAGAAIGGSGGAAPTIAPVEAGKGREAQAAAPVKRPQLAPADLRRGRARGAWPKKEEVLLRELFSSSNAAIAPTPDGAPDAPLRVRADLARSPWQPERHLLRVSVQGRSAPPPARRPANLVFVIDVSDSMAAPNRLALVQEGIRRMADRLIPEDRVAVVTYAAAAKIVLPSQPLGDKGLELRNALAKLATAGRTNGSEGLRLGLDVARASQVEGGPNVVVLCTDGNFNLGDTEPAPLAALAGAAATEGVHLSVFGFGRSDRNDLRLELLATAGGGRSCYVNTRDEAERLLAGQVDGLFAAAAVDVEIKVAFDRERVASVRRVDEPAADALDVKLPEVLPGRVAAAWYELVLRDEADSGPGPSLARVEAGYRRPGGEQRERQTGEAPVRAAAWGRTDESFRFGAATAEFARILQAGPAAAGPELDRLEGWVRANVPEAGGYRTELLENIAAAREAAALR